MASGKTTLANEIIKQIPHINKHSLAKAVKDFADSLRIEDTKNQFAAIEKEKAERLLALEELKATETDYWLYL